MVCHRKHVVEYILDLALKNKKKKNYSLSLPMISKRREANVIAKFQSKVVLGSLSRFSGHQCFCVALCPDSPP